MKTTVKEFNKELMDFYRKVMREMRPESYKKSLEELTMSFGDIDQYDEEYDAIELAFAFTSAVGEFNTRMRELEIDV